MNEFILLLKFYFLNLKVYGVISFKIVILNVYLNIYYLIFNLNYKLDHIK